MRIFKDVRLVEQLGSGMLRILQSYNRSIFEITSNFIRVTFKYNESHLEDLNSDLKKDLNCDLNNQYDINNIQEKIVMEMLKNDKITQKQLSLIVGINERNIRNNIVKLKQKGIVKRVGPVNGGYWKLLSVKSRANNNEFF